MKKQPLPLLLAVAAGWACLLAPLSARADILYVANSGDNTIEKFTPGGVGSVFANSGLNVPLGLAFDTAGNLYAANVFGNTIQKFTPGGGGSVFANAGLDRPTFLAFAPVPEPGQVAASVVTLLGIGGFVLPKRLRPKPASNVALA